MGFRSVPQDFLVLAAEQITGKRSQETLPAVLGLKYLAAGRGLPAAAATVCSANGLSSKGSPGSILCCPVVCGFRLLLTSRVWRFGIPIWCAWMMTVESLSAGVLSRLLKS